MDGARFDLAFWSLNEYGTSRSLMNEDVERADAFFSTHQAGSTPFPFPKDLFIKFVRENNGYFPVRIEALPEGSVIYPHVPVFQIQAQEEYATLATYLETLLTMIWVRYLLTINF
jgi:nicotinic acid phosphoribosyltransferase